MDVDASEFLLRARTELGLTERQTHRILEALVAGGDAEVAGCRGQLEGGEGRVSEELLLHVLGAVAGTADLEPSILGPTDEDFAWFSRRASWGERLETRPADTWAPLEAVELREAEPRDRERPVFIYTLHDGDVVSSDLAENPVLRDPEDDGRWAKAVARSFVEDRDWGADLVAFAMARSLDLPRFHRIRLARNFLDFGRFPVVTKKHHAQSQLARGAVHSPVSDLLPRHVQRRLLHDYDVISRGFEDAVHRTLTGREPEGHGEAAWRDVRFEESGLVIIGIHTYDEGAIPDAPRPRVSLIHRSESLQNQGYLTPGVFDPIYPSHMVQFTADRALTHRIGLVLERNYIPAVDNYPYCLPDGSVEMRSQAWFFFKYLESRFRAHDPAAFTPEVERVWHAIQDANSRSVATIRTMSVLHQFAETFHEGDGARAELDRLHDIYAGIETWARDSGAIDDYKYSPLRPSSLAIEVRKDAVCDGDDVQSALRRHFVPAFTPDGHAVFHHDEIRRIAAALAQGVRKYLVRDRPLKMRSRRPH